MPPKGKKTKAEEALDFLSNLDNLEDTAPATGATADASAPTGSTPRASTDSARAKGGKTSTDLSSSIVSESARAGTPAAPAEDEEAQKASAFSEAQIKTKRAPLSAPKPASRPATPGSSSAPAVGPGAGHGEKPPQASESPAPPPAPASTSGGGGGWGIGSSWSTATSAVQSAQKIADEQYKKVAAEGYTVSSGLEQLKGRGVDSDKSRKGAEERSGGSQGYVKGVDSEKLRQDLSNTTSTTLTTISNTVAPPISAHETLELWSSHPMVGYSGVEGVVYRAWTKILEQTESGELIILWSPERDGQDEGERGINPVEGWDEGFKRQQAEINSVKNREQTDPQGRAKSNPNLPVTTIPIFSHLQPLLAPLPIPEPSVLFKDDGEATSSTPPKHLYFLLTLHDPVHSSRFTTTTQPSPSDWLDVEYENSDWVEERLVEVLSTGVEIIAQDYVATRMGSKPSAVTRPASPTAKNAQEVESKEEVKKE